MIRKVQDQGFNLEDYKDLEHLELFARQIVEGFITGLHRSPFHGFSVEFSEHRIYNPGESTRNIDWKLYARTDRLYTKRYEEETNLRCHILMDTSSSMFFPLERKWNSKNPNKILFSSMASLSLMQLFKKQRDAVGLHFFGSSDFGSKAKSTYQHHKALSQEIYSVLNSFDEKRPNEKISMKQSLGYMAESLPKRSLVFIFSDLFELEENEDEILDALQHLKFQKHEIIICHTLDKTQEEQLEFDNRQFKFVDLESGESLNLNPSQIKEEYYKARIAQKENLKSKFQKYGIEYVEADVFESYYPIFQSYLLKRRRMKI